MSRLTVREVVEVLRTVAEVLESSGYEVGDRLTSILARWDSEVEAEEREEHARALADAESGEPW